MAKKQVEGHASKQAPANRTIWNEHVVFIVTGSNGKMFEDVKKAMNCLNAGREITAYYYRNGFTLKRNSAHVIPADSLKHIATVKRGCVGFADKIARINNAIARNGQEGVTITF